MKADQNSSFNGDLKALLAAARLAHARLAAESSVPAPNQLLAISEARVRNSVIRPLAKAARETESVAQAAMSSDGGVPSLWDVALHATTLSAAPRCPAELLEAAAALQDLVCQLDGVDGAATAESRLARLRALLEKEIPSVRTAGNGPLIATNVEHMHNWLGEPLSIRPLTALCRCGASAIKPYCDGSHAKGFDDAKDPSRVPDQLDTYVGQQVTVLDNRGTCQHSGFCTDRLPTAFRVKGEPFVAPSGGRMDEIIRAVRDCPSGALSYAIDEVEARADVDYHASRPPAIEVSKDGPYRITGGIALLDANGDDVVRNADASREHFTLCRCGHAKNKPFCTGMHWYINFRDPVPAQDVAPTMFEWAGGLPGLTRMMRLFYEKYVPADEVLSPLFANMAADHPQRVAKWLGEVFGGPKCYSEEYGGYPRMISQHVGKCITEEMRARWVSLLLMSARDAGLPNDPEFRSAFQSYIEWGSRLAVENSQTQSHPPLKMPMPHWGWNTAAGPPGGRASALAPIKADEPEPTVPAAEDPIQFTEHVKGFFRESDRDSMQFAFDLWSYADVSKHADAILERLRNGTMPCDGAWPGPRVEAFARWVAAGKPE